MIQADIIVIGAGPGGYELAAEQAQAGRQVVLIERLLPGGTCLNRGCIPTKCLCASAELITRLAHASEFGVDVEGVSLSYARAVQRMRTVVVGLREDVVAATSRCTCVHGEARFLPDGTVAVDNEVYSAPQIFIATGSRPASLPIPGAELAMNSDAFLQLEALPAEVAVIGGGVIGLEFAGIMAAFGTKVTVIEYCKEILPPFDREIAKRLRTMLTRRGIKFVLGAAVTAIEADGDRRRVLYQGKKGPEAVEADAVLMAVGRRAVLPEGLAEAGIEVSPRGFIVTDDNMRTTRPGVYAIGDCNGRLMLAHAATAQGRVATGQQLDLSVIPAAVFTTPEVAMVGATAEQLEAAGVEFLVKKATFAANGKARAMAEADGLIKVLYDPSENTLLGCHIVGPHAADLIAEAAMAINLKHPKETISNTVHGHPTLSEVLAASCAPVQ